MAASRESAAELVARMLGAYAAAVSYSDRGTAINAVQRVAFQTSFVRCQRFRFDHSDQFGPHVIWSDGVRTFTHWPAAARIGHPEIIDDRANLAIAIAAATGISSGAAFKVPSMLLPVSIGPPALAKLDALHFDGDENIDGHACARLSGRAPWNQPTKLWIDRETYLLRRIVERVGNYDTTTTYEPSLVPIDIARIEGPDVAKTPPQPREPAPWTGIEIAPHSLLVESIEKDSPAAQAGLTVGDEIESVNGRRMNQFADVIKALYIVEIGAQLDITIRRGGNTLDVVVRVAPAPSRTRPAPSGPLLE